MKLINYFQDWINLYNDEFIHDKKNVANENNNNKIIFYNKMIFCEK